MKDETEDRQLQIRVEPSTSETVVSGIQMDSPPIWSTKTINIMSQNCDLSSELELLR